MIIPSFRMATANGLCQLEVSRSHFSTSPSTATQKSLDIWWPRTTELHKNRDAIGMDRPEKI